MMDKIFNAVVVKDVKLAAFQLGDLCIIAKGFKADWAIFSFAVHDVAEREVLNVLHDDVVVVNDGAGRSS